MAFAILGSPKPSFFDSNGDPLVSGTLTISDPDTDLPKASYPTLADADAQSNANSNPLTLDSRGEPSTSLFGRNGNSYKVILKDSAGTTVWTIAKLTLPDGPDVSSYAKSIDTVVMSLTGNTITIANTTLAFTRTATVVESFTLAASASASAGNNNNVLAALIGVLQGKGYI